MNANRSCSTMHSILSEKMTTDCVDICTPFLVEVQTNASYFCAAHASWQPGD